MMNDRGIVTSSDPGDMGHNDILTPGPGLIAANIHSSDLSNSHEYIQIQVCGEQICTKQFSRSFGRN